jgi:hypothetical protein
MCGRPPWIGDRPDGAEAVGALGVGNGAPEALKVGVPGLFLVVVLVVVAAVGVDLPDLDLYPAQRAAGLVEQAAADVHDGAPGMPAAAGYPGEVVVLVQRQLERVERTLALVGGGQHPRRAGQRGGQAERRGRAQRAEQVPSVCHFRSRESRI